MPASRTLLGLSFLASGLLACGDAPYDPSSDHAEDEGLPFPLVVNEIAPNASFDVNGDGRISTADEFIELVNAGSRELDLAGVEISDMRRARFRFPDGSTLAPGEAALVVANAKNMSAGPGFQVFSAGSLGLNNGGDTVTVRRNGEIIERHGYGMDRKDKRSWNRQIDANKDALFELAKETPGTRRDGSAFASSIVSESTAESILASLHDECPDTFCGGDMNYFFTKGAGALDCNGAGVCTISYESAPWFGFYPEDVMEGRTPRELQTEDEGQGSATLTGSIRRDGFNHDGMIFVKTSCTLVGNFYTESDIVEEDGDPSDDFRDAFLDCVHGDAEFLLFGLPFYEGLLTQFERSQILRALDNICPDSFCAGDYTYFLRDEDGSFACDDEGKCSLELTVLPFDDEWDDNPLAGLEPSALTKASEDGKVTATILSSSVNEEGENTVRLRCDLAPGRELFAEDVYDREFDELTEEIDFLFGDCLAGDPGAETSILRSLPLKSEQ